MDDADRSAPVLRCWHALPAVVLALTMAVGLFGAARAMPDAWQSADRSLRDDARRAKFSAALVATPFAAHLARYQRELDWLVLRDLGPEVARGDGNWLFLREEWQLHPGRLAHARQRADALVAVAGKLHASGIALVVAVVPDKSRSVPARLGSLRRPPELATRVDDWTRRLRAGGVDVIDLSETLRDETRFLHTDSHWNEEGSRPAAEAIARRLRQRGAIAGPSVSMRVSGRREQREWGDLVRLAGIADLPARFRPLPDSVQRAEFVMQTAGDDLFGDAGAPALVVLGSSYSHRAQFLSYLQQACGVLVADFARDGGGFASAANAYLSGQAFAAHRPRAIVWEVPERSIEMPVEPLEAAWFARLPAWQPSFAAAGV